jgi:hypothetical protein
MTSGISANPGAGVRAPGVLIAVLGLHAALLLALSQGTQRTTRIELLRDGGFAGVGRLEAVLLDPEPPREIPLAPITFAEAPVMMQEPEVALGTDVGMMETGLEGLYLGQVRARIERAWQAAHSSATGAAVPIPCSVRVLQSTRGEVESVSVVECPLSADEKQLLARVIRGASPLPAPPAALGVRAELSMTLNLTP